ncbi:hypothetical protein BDV93DRAFT_602842 [Ceratobasidium sp. AG-I]|nr:hypothetical protein BDV93DRAFT_602842 [Ceratobasidium sp. AG-I]
MVLSYNTTSDKESPMATPTHRVAHNGASSKHIEPFFRPSTMQQLDSTGYPTRALYYLHKRLLDNFYHPVDHRSYLQTTPPISPPFTPPPVHFDKGTTLKENILALTHLVEQHQVLHDLCATLVSVDYIRPYTPPGGASPCNTPPRSTTDAPSPARAGALLAHDEHACRVARMLVQSNQVIAENGIDPMQELELELESEYEDGCATPKFKGQAWSCPSTIQRPVVSIGEMGEKENRPLRRNNLNLLEEMGVDGDGAATPCAKVLKAKVASEENRKMQQARRRARNSLNGAQGIRI